MHNQNLSKVVLAVVVATQLMGTIASGAQAFHSKVFSSKAEENRYFKLQARTISELSEEEVKKILDEASEAEAQFKFEVEAEERLRQTSDLLNKELTLPSVPPRFPVQNNSGSTATTGNTPTPTTRGTIDNVIMVVDKLIAIGQKIIPTIEKGKAIITNNPMAAVSVLPRLDTKDFAVHDMGGWSLPVSKHYKIAYKNGFGKEVISFIYSVSFQYGGSHDGKGKYLTGIRASARKIKVPWGFDLDATSQLIQISNIGSLDKVVAAAKIEMAYTVKNWTKTESEFVGFFVTGDGRLYKED